ncbi:MAG: hypothetical protein VKS61_08340 [Candidatus Sericytochromatia bacterium]|nr:hypothetical protein [Candidatus Sericytochromatia bacterium]
MPEHVWYDAAIDALARGDVPEARLAALRMLRQAPRSWDAVMVVALTTRDESLQVAAVEALAAHARVEQDRRGAYERLGRLQVWAEPARHAWLEGWQALGGDAGDVVASQGSPPAPAATAQLEQKLEAVLLERNKVAAEADASRREAEQLRVELAALRVTCVDVEARLGAQVQATAALERGLQEAQRRSEAERRELEASLEARREEFDGVADAAWQAERTKRLWVAVAAGGSLLAAGIIAVMVAARAPALAVEPSPKVLAASEEEGFRKALVALAAEASKLEADGDRAGAVSAWQCIAAISQDEGLTNHASQRVLELRGTEVSSAAAPLGRSRPPVAEVDFVPAPVVRSAQVVPAAKPRAERAPRPALKVSKPPRKVERTEAAGSRGHAQARILDPAPELVPADVRAKIFEP